MNIGSIDHLEPLDQIKQLLEQTDAAPHSAELTNVIELLLTKLHPDTALNNRILFATAHKHMTWLVEQVESSQGIIDSVMALHTRREGTPLHPADWCEYCVSTYPCITVKLLTNA